MDKRIALFLELSARLTGWSTFDLRGTGMLEDYVRAVDARLPQGLLDDLLAADGGVDAVMDDVQLGSLARSLIILWYTGSWTAPAGLPPPPSGLPGVISASAYQAGLMWRAAGAHPAGAEQQGYGAWASNPQAAP